MPQGGQLNIATRAEISNRSELTAGNYIVISVVDTGSGIPAHLIQKVFEPFFTTKPAGNGDRAGIESKSVGWRNSPAAWRLSRAPWAKALG